MVPTTDQILAESFVCAVQIVSEYITKVLLALFEILGEMAETGISSLCGIDQKNTVDTVDAEGWLHTGDVAEMDECGRIKIIDRVKVRVCLNRDSFLEYSIRSILEHYEAFSRRICRLGKDREPLQLLTDRRADICAGGLPSVIHSRCPCS